MCTGKRYLINTCAGHKQIEGEAASGVMEESANPALTGLRGDKVDRGSGRV